MQKKILIAVDESLHARNAAMYAAGLAARAADLRCTLFNVQPIISQYLLDEAKSDAVINDTLKRVIERNSMRAHELLDTCKEQMIKEGLDPQHIETITQSRMLGLARDIIEYARKNLFDAIIVGRRGLSRIQEMFMGSTSAKILEHGSPMATWVVDGGVSAHKFLVAVDDPDTAIAMVDYLCLICGGIKDIHLTFYHVPQELRDDEQLVYFSGSSELDAVISRKEKQIAQSFWPQALERLTAAGLGHGQLDMVTPPKRAKIGKMILDESRAHQYDTVVLGRRGGGRAFYFGSVSRYVAERIADRAVWIVG